VANRNWKQLAYPFLRMASRFYVGWLKLKGGPWHSVAVAVWHDGKVLKVRHSYRRGWRLPGGLVRQGEDPRRAACRELNEEVGLTLKPDDLTLIWNKQSGRRQYFVYQCQLDEHPQIRIDNWEIMEASFFTPR
jgi:8-oxo-dGTP diphosphatase